jgi:hypothetical protein
MVRVRVRVTEGMSNGDRFEIRDMILTLIVSLASNLTMILLNLMLR